jgi:hypothetical protein
MARKERLVDGDVLDPDRGLVAIDIDDLVDHQEGIAMRQKFQHARNVGRAERG